MKNFILTILKTIANNPEDIVISGLFGKQTVIFEVRCNNDDMGRIIGKSGKTIGAIRTLFSVAAARQKRKTLLEIVE
ncbi:MAG: KH domain-containing protein [Kiritimatiellia bacterium]